jgi:hypothetical protein
MARKKKAELKQVMFRVDHKLLAAYDAKCRKRDITREGAIRQAMEAATGRRSLRRPGKHLAHAPSKPKPNRRKTAPRVDTPSKT